MMGGWGVVQVVCCVKLQSVIQSRVTTVQCVCLEVENSAIAAIAKCLGLVS